MILFFIIYHLSLLSVSFLLAENSLKEIYYVEPEFNNISGSPFSSLSALENLSHGEGGGSEM